MDGTVLASKMKLGSSHHAHERSVLITLVISPTSSVVALIMILAGGFVRDLPLPTWKSLSTSSLTTRTLSLGRETVRDSLGNKIPIFRK